MPLLLPHTPTLLPSPPVAAASVSVAPTIQQLLVPLRNHHWCIPFSVTGNPKPELQWYHENEPLQEQDFIHTMIHDYTESEYHGCLQLTNPTHIHNGVYRLVAKNMYGRDEKKVIAQFIKPPNINHTGDGADFTQRGSRRGRGGGVPFETAVVSLHTC